MKKLVSLLAPPLVLLVAVGIFMGYRSLNAVEVTEAPVQLPKGQPVYQEPKKAPISVQGLFELTNAERAKVGVAPLKLDERLNQSAQRKVDEMVAENHYGHLNLAGVHGYTYVSAFLECSYASENINNRARYSNDTVTSWMNSPLHRDAILDPRYDLVGFGVSGEYVVQHFCSL